MRSALAVCHPLAPGRDHAGADFRKIGMVAGIGFDLGCGLLAVSPKNPATERASSLSQVALLVMSIGCSVEVALGGYELIRKSCEFTLVPWRSVLD
jgi:hypothetical protein